MPSRLTNNLFSMSLFLYRNLTSQHTDELYFKPGLKRFTFWTRDKSFSSVMLHVMLHIKQLLFEKITQLCHVLTLLMSLTLFLKSNF